MSVGSPAENCEARREMLVTCPECGAKVSKQADPCPKCGYPCPGRMSVEEADEYLKSLTGGSIWEREPAIDSAVVAYETAHRRKKKIKKTIRLIVLVLVILFVVFMIVKWSV
jgi:uncharacterized membrane protein YvbJ